METGYEQAFRDEAADAWSDSEESRRRQLSEDARRSLVGLRLTTSR
jgi:hypothetical protein